MTSTKGERFWNSIPSPSEEHRHFRTPALRREGRDTRWPYRYRVLKRMFSEQEDDCILDELVDVGAGIGNGDTDILDDSRGNYGEMMHSMQDHISTDVRKKRQIQRRNRCVLNSDMEVESLDLRRYRQKHEQFFTELHRERHEYFLNTGKWHAPPSQSWGLNGYYHAYVPDLESDARSRATVDEYLTEHMPAPFIDHEHLDLEADLRGLDDWDHQYGSNQDHLAQEDFAHLCVAALESDYLEGMPELDYSLSPERNEQILNQAVEHYRSALPRQFDEIAWGQGDFLSGQAFIDEEDATDFSDSMASIHEDALIQEQLLFPRIPELFEEAIDASSFKNTRTQQEFSSRRIKELSDDDEALNFPSLVVEPSTSESSYPSHDLPSNEYVVLYHLLVNSTGMPAQLSPSPFPSPAQHVLSEAQIIAAKVALGEYNKNWIDAQNTTPKPLPIERLPWPAKSSSVETSKDQRLTVAEFFCWPLNIVPIFSDGETEESLDFVLPIYDTNGERRSKLEALKEQIKMERMRWHEDKMKALFGDVVAVDEKAKSVWAVVLQLKEKVDALLELSELNDL